jgi:heme/copper-type cytochrome/quinol oxidase subunit 4
MTNLFNFYLTLFHQLKPLAQPLLIEAALILATLNFLVQPHFFFPFRSRSARAVGTWSGMLLLCITFCWSVIFGCMWAIVKLNVNHA